MFSFETKEDLERNKGKSWAFVGEPKKSLWLRLRGWILTLLGK